MKTVLLAVVVLWGTAVLLRSVVGHPHHGNGAFAAGQAAGVLVAGLLVFLAFRALLKGR
jgi:hypothetical protein